VKNGLILAWGWDSLACDGYLTVEDLDEVTKTYPIAVWDRSLHMIFVNSKFLSLAKLTFENCGHVNGVGVYRKVNPVTRKEEFRLKGQFMGHDAILIVNKIIVRGLAHLKNMCEAMRHSVELARQGGITTLCELLLGAINVNLEENLYDAFFNDDGCPMRCCAVISAKDLKRLWGSNIARKFLIENRWLKNVVCRPFARFLFDTIDRFCTYCAIRHLAEIQIYSTEKLIYNNGVKFMLDDSYINLTIQMGSPGFCDSSDRGLWNIPPERLVDEMYPFWKAGCRIHVHSNGDASNDLLSKALKICLDRYPRFDHRFCIEHFGQANLSIIRRLKQLNASVSVNPYYVHDRAEINEQLLGTDRAHSASCVKTIIENGLVCAMHSDAPVGVPAPLKLMYIACERKLRNQKSFAAATAENTETSFKTHFDNTKKANPGLRPECVTPYEALRMVTVDAAYVVGLDDLIGSIEPGKLADFTVLEENPLNLGNGQALKDIPIWGTVVGGKLYPLKNPDGKTSKHWNLSYIDQIPEAPLSERIYGVPKHLKEVESKTYSFFESLLWLYCFTYDDSFYSTAYGHIQLFSRFIFRPLLRLFAEHVFKVPNIIRRKPSQSSRAIIQRNIRRNFSARNRRVEGINFFLCVIVALLAVTSYFLYRF